MLRSLALIRRLRRSYIHSGTFQSLLDPENISIIPDFQKNWSNVERFYARYYGDDLPGTVLCGLNPGRLGAGKTGIPFLDFASLSQLLDGIDRADRE